MQINFNQLKSPNVSFWQEGKTGVHKEKRQNSTDTQQTTQPTVGVEPRPDWRKGSALTSA